MRRTTALLAMAATFITGCSGPAEQPAPPPECAAAIAAADDYINATRDVYDIAAKSILAAANGDVTELSAQTDRIDAIGPGLVDAVERYTDTRKACLRVAT